MSSLKGLAGQYDTPKQLDPRAFIKPVDCSVTDRGLVKLEQDGATIVLTPTELKQLLLLVA